MGRVSATDLKPGQVIRIEYGDYDNWMDFTVDAVEEAPKGIRVKCHKGRIEQSFLFKKSEIVEVKA